MLLFLLFVFPLAVIGDEIPVNGNRVARPLHGIPRPQPPPLYIKTLEVPYPTAAPIQALEEITTRRPFAWSAYYKSPLVAQPQPAEIIIENHSEAPTVPNHMSYVPTQRTFTWPAVYNTRLISNSLEHSHPVASLSTTAAPIVSSSLAIDDKPAVSYNVIPQPSRPLSTPRPFIQAAPVEVSTQKPIIYESTTQEVPVVKIELEIDTNTGEMLNNIPSNYYVPSVSKISTPVQYPTTSAPIEIIREPEIKIKSYVPPQKVYVPPQNVNVPPQKMYAPQLPHIRPAPVQPAVVPQPAVQPQPIQLNVKYESCSQGNGYYSVRQECDSYIECKKNVQAKFFCPDGLLFNPATVWPEYPCAYPTEVKCEGQVVQPPQPSGSCPRQYGYFPAPDGDCGNYLMCQAGNAIMMQCPAGLAFNTLSNSCDWPDNVGTCSSVSALQGFVCPEPPLDESGKPSEIIAKYRYGQSCNEYIACQSGHPRLLSCDIGSSFDEASQKCVSSNLVSNCGSQK